ncbi:unnamed protein product [Moneuplotes crassus]|uniref:Structural maintenance of chromosomes protein n=1 Tax=Euplotes crassus TaxID=5936 RepID=A0AAD2DAQ4_EUPCR|nr:unnamed protein product [Moneuplotes crassus]
MDQNPVVEQENLADPETKDLSAPAPAQPDNVEMAPQEESKVAQEPSLEEEKTVPQTPAVEEEKKIIPEPPEEVSKQDETIRRLMIYKIELNNFKSYAGKKEIGPLHKCFSTVVGPNGSGKSNLIESLLFVFGYRMKKLRSDKISSIIHRSESKPHVQYASVSIYFQEIIDFINDESKYEPIRNTQFVISRIGFRDNKSKYYFNNEECLLSDVARILKEKGIDLQHNRFLILQGEVEMIAQMRPKGMTPKETGFLEFLEEIIGSHKYVNQIEHFSSKIEECSEQRVDRVNTLKQIESGVKSVEKEKNFAISYIRSEERYYKLRHIFLCSEKGEYSILKDKVSIKINETQHELESIEAEVKKKTDDYKNLVTDIKKIMEEFKVCDRECIKLDDQFREYEREDIKKRQDVSHYTELQAKTKAEIERLEEKKEAAENSLKELKIQLPTLEEEWKELAKEKDAKKEVLMEIEKTIEAETKGLRDQKMKLEEQLRPKEIEYNKVNEEKAAFKIELDTIQKRRRGYTDEKERVEIRIKEVSKKVSEIQNSMEKITTEEKRNLDQISSLKEEEKSLTITSRKIEEKINKKKEIIEVAKNCIEGQKTNSRLVEKLFEGQRKGKLRGIKGRLGNLGSIDSKYDIAISTCCSLLDSIVVETVDDGTLCMEYLRAHQIGKANFLCLDRIKEKNRALMKREFQAPENSKRIFNLVHTKDEYKEAFYFALKNTLVCPNLETATKLGYKGSQRYRVVSLEGELIELSGTLSGGGRPRKGMMRLKQSDEIEKLNLEYTNEQIERFERELYELKKEYKQFRYQISSCLDQISICEDKIDKREFELAKAKDEINLKTFNAEIEKLKASVKNYEELLENPEELSKLETLESSIKSRDETLREIYPEMSKIKEKIAEKENEIMEVGGENYKKVKEEFLIISDKEEKKQTLINRTKGNIEYTTSDLSKAKSELVENSQKIKTIAENLEKLNAELTVMDKKAAIILADFNEAKKKKEKINGTLEDHKHEFDEKKRALEKLETEKREMNDKCNDLIQKKRRYIEAMQTKDDKIKENIKEYKRIKIDYTFYPYLEDLQRGDLPEKLLNQEDPPRQPREDRKEPEPEELKAPDKRGIMSWDYYVNHCEFGQILSTSQCEHIAESRREIAETLKFCEQEIQKMRPNIQSIDEYIIKLKKFKNYEKDLNQVEDMEREMRANHEMLRKRRYDEFMKGFDIISKELKSMYQCITMGGDAELELVDHLDPFSEGINFSVRPLKKTWKQISKLSGGEKTLSSLSLIFALHQFKPTPLYFMDEIDAALDYKNVAIVANYIKKKARNAQFLIISLRQNMFELANKMLLEGSRSISSKRSPKERMHRKKLELMRIPRS